MKEPGVGDSERVEVRYVLGAWEVHTRGIEVVDVIYAYDDWDSYFSFYQVFIEPYPREDEPRNPPSHPPGAPVTHDSS